MQKSAVFALLAYAVVAHAASFTTYIGDANPYQVLAIATDAAGNTYVTGSRVIVPVSYLPNSPAATDVFVSKLDPSGNLTLLATFSGKGTDQANGIAVDPSGNIYIAGTTTSTDFPLRNPLQSTSAIAGGGPGFNGTGFLMKLSADGTVIYSTYMGGAGAPSLLTGVAADSEGNAYVVGTTSAPDYPHTPGMPTATVGSGTSGAFFAKIDPTGSQILYAGVLAGQVSECGSPADCGVYYTVGTAVAIDPAGNAYIAGNAGGAGLPTTAGALLKDGIGAFVAKVNSAGTGLVYATYLGPGTAEGSLGTVPTDQVYAIAADGAGNAYLAGSTSDTAFPVTPSAFQTSPSDLSNAPADTFVAKLNPTGSAMVWATFLGAAAAEGAQSIAIDAAGDVWISGVTQSGGFPVKDTVFPHGSEFLAELNSTGSALPYSALFPGKLPVVAFPNKAVAAALAVDASGTLHVGGSTGVISAFPSGSAPGQTPAPYVFGIANAAGGDLSGRVAPAELIAIYGLHLGPAAPVTATFNAAGFLPTTLAGVEVTIDGTPAPLLYVSDTQINAVAPVELTTGVTELQVAQNSVPLPDFRVVTDATAPGVFLNPDGSAAAINQDGTVNSQANPAKVGSYVSIWATGTGYFPGSDGQMATGPNQFCNLQYGCLIGHDESAGTPSYAGAAPGMVNGVVQINFQVAPGSVGYTLNVGSMSDAFNIYTTP